jgi:hypothetical protein
MFVVPVPTTCRGWHVTVSRDGDKGNTLAYLTLRRRTQGMGTVPSLLSQMSKLRVGAELGWETWARPLLLPRLCS